MPFDRTIGMSDLAEAIPPVANGRSLESAAFGNGAIRVSEASEQTSQQESSYHGTPFLRSRSFSPLTPPGRPHTPRPCDPDSAHLSLLVDDLPALYGRLRSEGVAFVSEPVRIDAGPNAGGYGVYLRDPNGVLIELFQPPRPAS